MTRSTSATLTSPEHRVWGPDDLEIIGGQSDDKEQRGNARIRAKFNPSERRVPSGEHGGEWTAGGALKDLLKLAGKIDLDEDEKLAGSAKVDGDSGTVRLALTEHHGVKSLRMGLGGSAFGSRNDDEGPWRGAPGRAAKINAERKRLTDEQESLQAEWDRLDADPHADPARKQAIDARLEELDGLDMGEVYPSGYTAKLDQPRAQRLRADLAVAVEKADRVKADEDARWDNIERETERVKAELKRVSYEREPFRVRYVAALEGKGPPLSGQDDATFDQLQQRWEGLWSRLQTLEAGDPVDPQGVDLVYEASLTKGSVPGVWADVHYEVYYDDGSVHVTLGAVPHDSGLDLNDLSGNEEAAHLDSSEARRLLTVLGRYVAATGGTDFVQAAAGHDVTPGHDELHHYWTRDPRGLSQWVDSPKPWTTLVALLTKHVGPAKAKVFASRWFIEVFGYAAGSDKNRVAHGHPPRGHVVGPG